jgi:quercetin dioxygenase-like cupin family protein
VRERTNELRASLADIAGFEVVMEGQDMRSVVLTLAAGQCVPWHYHSDITDSFICIEGPMVVETRAPRATHVLVPGQRCEVPPKTAHHVHGQDGGPCKFMVLQGVVEYDNVAVGGS